MLYSVGIKNEKGLGVFHYLVRIHLNDDFTFFSTAVNEECKDFEFILYNDEDNSLQSLSREGLIDLIKSNIKINGVSCVQLTDGVKEVSINIVRPPLHNLFKLKSVDKIFERTHTFHKDYMRMAGVSKFDNESHILVVSNSMYSSTYGVDICIVNNEIVSTPLNVGIKGIKNQDIIKLGNTIALHLIDENNQVSKYNQISNAIFITKGYVSSVIDLYILAIHEPQFIIGCDVSSNHKFIINTLAERYVFEIADGLKQYMLKSKLLSLPYFGIDKVNWKGWF